MAEDYQTRKDIDRLYDLIWDNDTQQLALVTKEELQDILDYLSIGKFNYEKFNFAVADNKFWIMSNAKYNYDAMRFVKLDINYTSFAICLQPDTDSHNLKFYYNPRADEIVLDEETYDYNDYILNHYLGAIRKNGGELVLYDIDVGWMSIEYVPKTDWETVSIEATGCDLIVNKELRLAQFSCNMPNQSLSISYTPIATIPADYKPPSMIVLPFTNVSLNGYISRGNGTLNVVSTSSGTFNVQTSAMWHY